MTAQRILTAKSDPSINRLQSFALDRAESLDDCEALLAVRRVALTTNNITYALFGERMQYWRFFPLDADDAADWGVVPVWGFADVAASRVDGLAVGERVYGFLPLATHLVVRPGDLSRGRFVDALSHRAALPAIYNQYLRCAADPSYRPEDEGIAGIVRPLFATAFLLADFLHEQGWFDARQVVLSSASSKTAYATAWCLRELGGVDVVGLTSDRHAAFVQSLGVFDRVLGYGGLASLDPAIAALYLDYSGSATLRERVHRHFGDMLKHSAVIGATQFSAGAGDAVLPGPRPVFFFAPEQARRRAESWGNAELQRRIGESQRRFVQRALGSDEPWLRVVEHEGLPAAIEVLGTLAVGDVDPRLGHAVRVG